MRVLWFSVTPSLYSAKGVMHNAGGWIASLESIVRREPSVTLAIAFLDASVEAGVDHVQREGVTYYPVAPKRPTWRERLAGQHPSMLDRYMAVIDDFHPDLIQIFGGENDFGVVCEHTQVPVVIHIQGCLPPYYNALFPVDMNRYDFLFTPGLTLRRRFIGWRSKPAFAKGAAREVNTMRHCHYFMGRTQWDKTMVELFHPAARYYHVDEALRDSFLATSQHWQWTPLEARPDGKALFVSVLSNPWYKGVDLVLKTAQLLQQYTTLPFEWKIFGVSDIRFFEHKYGIRAHEVGVTVCGVASKETLVDTLCTATCYVHPSYIENSPNSICEPQYLGVPVVATHVGGVATLLDDGVAGWLVPANAPYELAVALTHLATDQTLAERYSLQARSLAQVRHNPQHILSQLLAAYSDILQHKAE